MKYIFCLAALVAACATIPGQVKVAPHTTMASGLLADTVALYAMDHPTLPHCTGVWIGEHTMVTAAHCIDVGRDLLVSSVDDTENTFAMHLVKADLFHDLALYEASGAVPKHPFAEVGLSRPMPGENLSFTGNPAGLVGSWRTGYVSAYREISYEMGAYVGPWMQVSAPIYLGDSGGGAFNSDGQLVGIVHSMADEIPNVAFCVSIDTIRVFLE